MFQPPLSAITVDYNFTSWCGILFVGIFGTVLAYGLYNEGIKLISPARASITATLESVIAGFISYLFIGEGTDILQVMGAVLIIASVLLLQTRKKVYMNDM